MVNPSIEKVEVIQSDREAVAAITGVIEGTNSWTFLMRGDWDEHYLINEHNVPDAPYKVPWCQIFARHRQSLTPKVVPSMAPHVAHFLRAVRRSPGGKYPVQNYYDGEADHGSPSWKIAEQHEWVKCLGSHRWELTEAGLRAIGAEDAGLPVGGPKITDDDVEWLADIYERAAWGRPLPKEGEQGRTTRIIGLRGTKAVIEALTNSPTPRDPKVAPDYEVLARDMLKLCKSIAATLPHIGGSERATDSLMRDLREVIARVES